MGLVPCACAGFCLHVPVREYGPLLYADLAGFGLDLQRGAPGMRVFSSKMDTDQHSCRVSMFSIFCHIVQDGFPAGKDPNILPHRERMGDGPAIIF